MNYENYSIEALSRAHNRTGFSCGVVELDQYLQKDARRHNSSGFNQTKVLVETGEKAIIGFYSYAAASLARQLFPRDKQNSFPNYEIPCFRLTRFGIDKRYQKSGFGSYLLYCALKHAVELSSNIGSYAVLVDAKNEEVKSFYIKNGFYPLSGFLLYLPIKEIKAELD
ncbi:MAG: GNAT family N-acetyltransferase [Sphaerochaeta sp.]|nr:GNAT family N-acetyltransferase [Sphaerochaeta sp.]